MDVAGGADVAVVVVIATVATVLDDCAVVPSDDKVVVSSVKPGAGPAVVTVDVEPAQSSSLPLPAGGRHFPSRPAVRDFDQMNPETQQSRAVQQEFRR